MRKKLIKIEIRHQNQNTPWPKWACEIFTETDILFINDRETLIEIHDFNSLFGRKETHYSY